MMKKSIPKAADQVYFLVTIPWIRRLENYCKGQTPEQPGQLNPIHEVNQIVFKENFINFNLDPCNNLHLSNGNQEEVNYSVLDYDTYQFLKNRYGSATDIPRFSIAVPCGIEKTDYVVEINLRKFQIVSWPFVKYIKQIPMTYLFTSRYATVKELHF